ncbi:YsnF/AvaK domain-containing protein [Dyadobacter crusticola]|uniref:YsnF/AvaK domain-containing protein n=1 Tax=Dyadobacter crusticola TaxID=292407 RepID=UPI00068EB4C4|nr:YsnF/AvaK domain-containing protein [Dyadobacter crusticola]
MNAREDDFQRINQGLPAEQSQIIPVIAEKLVVTTERVETGSVLVSKKVVEEEVQIDRTIESDQVVVERKEINRYVETAPPAVRQEGDVTIISVMKEVLVVEKRLMLVEEVHITRQQEKTPQRFSETLRREEVSVSRNHPGQQG